MTSIYLDCNATTPLEPKVAELVTHFLTDEFGNAGSRTHEFGARAKSAVAKARASIAQLVGVDDDEVIFTSGATESNNLSILGLAKFGKESGRLHIISGQHEHKAVLEPLDRMKSMGFEVTLLPVNEKGYVEPELLRASLRKETLLVSMMHVNNETGVIQPIEEYAQILLNSDAFFHVDASQSFGKLIPDLKNKRIDLMSASGHKIFAPKGIGVLITRSRQYQIPPIEPLMVGGGQEGGMRPGTLPVHLIVGLGEAATLAQKNHQVRQQKCQNFKEKVLLALQAIGGIPNGDPSLTMPNTLNISFSGLDSEALILQLKDVIAISNGSACTSSSYTFSHVLTAMNLPKDRIKGSIRISWCHLTESVDWDIVAEKIQILRQ